MKKENLSVSLLLCLIFYACEKEYANDDNVIFINEVMPVNSTVVSDPDGDYDDWIELYNISSEDQDISGWFLSDNEKHISKYQFPASTRIAAKGYLIIWADDDSSSSGLHANFKLSSLGEELILSDPEGNEADKVIYPGQSLELTYSRNPDGTGAFQWQLPTFARTNNIK